MKSWLSKYFGPGLSLGTLGSNSAEQEFCSDVRLVLYQRDTAHEAVPARGQG